MDKIIAQATIDFGKIAFNYSGRKRNAADVEIELRECGGEPTYDCNGMSTGHMTPKYTELAIVGQVWNSTHTDIVMGGAVPRQYETIYSQRPLQRDLRIVE